MNGYELLTRLAAGGMGEVFVAKKVGSAGFEKRVALKLLLPHLIASPESVERFYNEARIAARMRHPNIVEIFDVGEADGRPFIAMQLVEGVSLSQHVKHLAVQGLTAHLPIVRAIALGACEALTYAHALCDDSGRPLRLIHRDVTPSNILLAFNGAVQLTDFGIARIGEHATRSGSLLGKPSFVAPEQVTHEFELDGRADQYSAALSLYVLLTGGNPFHHRTTEDTLAAVMAGILRPPREIRSDVTPGMEAALLRALSRDPGDRFPDMTSFRRAFVDGPVAGAPELAAHVLEVNAPFKDTLRRTASPISPGTRSHVVHVTRDSASVPSSGRRRRRLPPWSLALGAGLATVAVSAFGWGAFHRRQSDDGRIEAPAALAPREESLGVPSTLTGTNPTPPAVPPVADAPSDPVTERPEPRPPPTGEPARGGEGRPEPALPRSKTKPARLDPPPTETRAVGYLTADAEPWADVLVDGVAIDCTPFSQFPLPVGPHVITFRAPDGQVVERQVTISDGASTTLKVDFSAPP